jgi:phage shock protein B
MTIDDGLFVLGIIFLVCVAPIWIVAHYITRWRAARRLSSEDENSMSELWQKARQIEVQIENLERVLDAEAPSWRRRAGGSTDGLERH